MPKAPLPAHEMRRLAALHRYRILDSADERSYDDLVHIVAGICDMPMGMVSLLDEKRQWFKARTGIEVSETPREQAFCGYAILQPHSLLIVPDARRDERFRDNPLVTGPPYIRFYAGAPLVTSQGDALGTLCVMDASPPELGDYQRDALAALARQVVALMELRAAHRELAYHLKEREWYERALMQQQNEMASRNLELEQRSRTDALTGLSNRRAFDERLREAVLAASAEARPLALAVIDIDHFKQINDTHGHPAGDGRLVEVATCLVSGADHPQDVARYGGEEFVLLLADNDAAAAQFRCEEIRQRVAALPSDLPVTVSIGIAVLDPGDTVATLLARADQAMYAAKREGRNRVCVTARQ